MVAERAKEKQTTPPFRPQAKPIETKIEPIICFDVTETRDSPGRKQGKKSLEGHALAPVEEWGRHVSHPSFRGLAFHSPFDTPRPAPRKAPLEKRTLAPGFRFGFVPVASSHR